MPRIGGLKIGACRRGLPGLASCLGGDACLSVLPLASTQGRSAMRAAFDRRPMASANRRPVDKASTALDERRDERHGPVVRHPFRYGKQRII